MEKHTFNPHPLLKGGMAQTIAGTMVGRKKVYPKQKREYVELDDGDQLVLMIDEPNEATPSTPVLLLLHGLGGCSESGYNLAISDSARAHGYKVIRFNHRGCGPEGTKLAKGIYHAGRHGDVYQCLSHLQKSWPEADLFVCGFSLSANLLLSLVGRNPDIQKEIPNLRAIAAVSGPLDLEKCSQEISRRRNLLLDQYFARRLRRHVHSRHKSFPELGEPQLPKWFGVRSFDASYTSVQAEFSDRDHYYQEASALPWVDKIKVPTYVLAAQDDPIIADGVYESAKFSESCEVQVEKKGGHMGFIEKNPESGQTLRWMDMQILRWFEHHRQQKNRNCE